jgi:hypothetical protein
VTDANSVPIPNPLTFAGLQSCKNQLKGKPSCLPGSYGNGYDATEQDIRAFCLSQGFLPQYINERLAVLNSRGNEMLAGTNGVRAFFFYAEKL